MKICEKSTHQMYTVCGVIRQNTHVVATLVGFRKNVAHITVYLPLSKSGTTLDRREVNGALLNGFAKAPECILIDIFNAKLHTQSLVSHIACNFLAPPVAG